MAEMASVQPIAGAQYHWTHYLAPPQYRRFITWMQVNIPYVLRSAVESVQLSGGTVLGFGG